MSESTLSTLYRGKPYMFSTLYFVNAELDGKKSSSLVHTRVLNPRVRGCLIRNYTCFEPQGRWLFDT